MENRSMSERPVDIATASTLQFVTESLPVPTTVVEVGCGQGDLAVALQTQGYTVTAIDSDREANVAQASELVDLTDRSEGETEAISHRSFDYSHDCHFQPGCPPRAQRDQ